MELQFSLPTKSVLRPNQEGQWKMRTKKLIEMMIDNAMLRNFEMKAENGNVNINIIDKFIIAQHVDFSM
jgi:hypothetical protein